MDPKWKASRISGYKVPINTVNIMVKSSMPFNNNPVSRLEKNDEENLEETSVGKRNKNKKSAKTAKRPSNNNKNTPRLGSLANACAEIKRPDRTKNVPSTLNVKQMRARKTANAFALPVFSTKMST